MCGRQSHQVVLIWIHIPRPFSFYRPTTWPITRNIPISKALRRFPYEQRTCSKFMGLVMSRMTSKGIRIWLWEKVWPLFMSCADCTWWMRVEEVLRGDQTSPKSLMSKKSINNSYLFEKSSSNSIQARNPFDQRVNLDRVRYLIYYLIIILYHFL